MRLSKGMKVSILANLLVAVSLPVVSFAAGNGDISPVTTNQVFEQAKKNNNWKLAFVTGKDAQVVFMSVSKNTNPNNEIGLETHKFDQIIFIAEGKAKAILNGKSSMVKSGDMIFIPQGVPHNFVNLNPTGPLKIISVYSATDIPANAVYKKMSDVPPE